MQGGLQPFSGGAPAPLSAGDLQVILTFFGKERTFSTTPTPPYRNEGSQPFPQTPFPLQGRGLTDSEGKPSSSGFGYGSQSLCPSGEP